MSDAPQGGSPRGLARDFHRAKQGTTASAAELREFVQKLHGKSPQEMLGLVAGSNLIQSTILATIITFVLILAFTIVPYALDRNSPATAKAELPVPAAPAPAAAPTATAAVAATPATPTAAPTGSAALPATSPNAAPPDPVLDRLGIGETKAADPKKNPLEAGADDLLKDLK